MPWIVFTDEPTDFIDLDVRVIRYEATGPMAIDFVTKLTGTGDGRGAPAYHDKRLLLQTVLEEFDSAIFIDADSRMRSVPRLPNFASGIAANKAFMESITKHLNRWGQSRRTAFEQLAVELIGNANALHDAHWVSECLFAVTKDGNESKFFAAWDRGAKLLHSHNIYTGEGGAIGLAAAYAGWTIDYRSLSKLAAATQHEGGGPKTS